MLMDDYFDYTYINQRGFETTDTYMSLMEALRAAARDHESGLKTPLEIKNDQVKYEYQEILVMCQKYKLF